jgi:hypothetical protein
LSTLTVNPVNQAYLQSTDVTYDVALEGLGSVSPAVGNVLGYVGQATGSQYYVWQMYLGFDVSDVEPGSVFTGGTFRLYLNLDASVTDFDVQLRAYDYGDSISSASWATPTDLAAAPLCGTANTANIQNGILSFTLTSEFVSWLKPSGLTKFVVCSSKNVSETAPTTDEYVCWMSIGCDEKISLVGVVAGETLTLVSGQSYIPFTAHATTTTPSLREFAVSGTDSADATQLRDCLNDATYGIAAFGTAYKAYGTNEITITPKTAADVPITATPSPNSHFTVVEGNTVWPILEADYTAGSDAFGPITPVLTTPADVAWLRSKIAQDPEWEPWATFRDSTGTYSGLNGAMSFVPSPSNTNYSREGNICGALDTASRYCRNVATAYACTGTATYATKARDILVYWATYEVAETYVPPPTYVVASSWYPDRNCRFYGFHMSWGCYAFALAYSLIRNSSVLSASDRTLLDGWFVDWAKAHRSYALLWIAAETYALGSETRTYAYSWTENPLGLMRNMKDWYIGWDAVAGNMHAWLAACNVSGYKSDKDNYIYNPDFVTNAHEIIARGANPRNDGDGVPGHPVPVPQVQIPADSSKYYSPGCVTYMHFNARFHALVYALMANEGKSTAQELTYMNNEWNYLARFNGVAGSHEWSPQGIEDTYDMDNTMAHLELAAGVFDNDTAKVKVAAYDNMALYEAQSSGWCLLTAPIYTIDDVPPDDDDGDEDDDDVIPGGGIGNEGSGYRDDAIDIEELFTLPWFVDEVNSRLDNFLELGRTDFVCDGSTTLFHLTDANVNMSSVRVWHTPIDTGVKVELTKGADWTEEWSDDWFSINTPLNVDDRITTRYTYRHWNSNQVAAQINAGFDYLFPEFYVVKSMEVIGLDGVYDYELTDSQGQTIERIVNVEIYPAGSTSAYRLSPYYNYRVTRIWGRTPRLRVFNISAGDVVMVYYQARADHFGDPVVERRAIPHKIPALTNTTLSDLGLPNHMSECLILYACWRLLTNKTSPRVRADSPSIMRQEGISTAQEMMTQARLMKLVLDIEVKKRKLPPVDVLGV